MTITKEEWIARCAAQYQKRGWMEQQEAKEVAELMLNDTLNGDLTENPEDSADEDMSYWSE